jgi:hypothetical protein
MFEFRIKPKYNTIFHAGFHKCLTVYFKRVLNCMGTLHSLDRIKLSINELDQARMQQIRKDSSRTVVLFRLMTLPIISGRIFLAE